MVALEHERTERFFVVVGRGAGRAGELTVFMKKYAVVDAADKTGVGGFVGYSSIQMLFSGVKVNKPPFDTGRNIKFLTF